MLGFFRKIGSYKGRVVLIFFFALFIFLIPAVVYAADPVKAVLGWLIDWVKIKKYLIGTYDILEFKYYAGLKDNDEAMKSFLRYLNKVGLTWLPNH